MSWEKPTVYRQMYIKKARGQLHVGLQSYKCAFEHLSDLNFVYAPGTNRMFRITWCILTAFENIECIRFLNTYSDLVMCVSSYDRCGPSSRGVIKLDSTCV